MILRLLTDSEARASFGDSEQWEETETETGRKVDHGVGETSPALLRVFADLSDVIGDIPATLTVCRDWEGCLSGLLETEDVWDIGLSDIIALTETGRVGSGGVNQPLMFDSVSDWREHNRQTREENLRAKLGDAFPVADPVGIYAPHEQVRVDELKAGDVLLSGNSVISKRAVVGGHTTILRLYSPVISVDLGEYSYSSKQLCWRKVA